MITGFNTDVEHAGRVFHVQTEDRGLQNPIVDSLVYTGGEIVASRQRSYADLAESGECIEDDIMERMERQHQTLIREILNGKFDPEGPKPFGHNIVTNRSLDEVVLSYLRLATSEEPIAIRVLEDQVLVEGTTPSVRMKVVEPGTQRAVECPLVTIRLVSTGGEPRDLFFGPGEIDGSIAAAVELPEMPGADMALLVLAEAGGKKAETRLEIKKTATASVQRA